MLPHPSKNNHRNVWICAYSILISNYNCGITSYIVFLRNYDRQSSSTTVNIDLHDQVLASLSVIVGLLLGQIVFGALGDCIGRRRSFLGSTVTMAVGSLLSVCTGDLPLVSGSLPPLLEFALFRFAVGFGAGGLYPVVAAISRESSQEHLANSVVALVFGPIGSVGLMLPPLVVLFLSLTALSSPLQWRLLVLAGALPACALSLARIQEPAGSKGSAAGSEDAPAAPPSSLYLLAGQLRHGTVRAYLLGSCLSWFFSDILLYGNLLYQVLFLDSLLSDKNTLDDDYYHFSISILAAIGLGSATLFWLGGILSVVALRNLSAVALQLHGFALSAAAFFLVALCKATLSKTLWPLTIASYMGTYLLVGLGPAPATFLVPSLLFSAGSGIRSTANGLAAGCGKLGSIAGLLVVGYAGFDISATMTFFGAVAVLGVAASLFTIREHMRAEPGHYFRLSSSSAGKQVRVARSLYLPIRDESGEGGGEYPRSAAEEERAARDPWEEIYSSFRPALHSLRPDGSPGGSDRGDRGRARADRPFARLLSFVTNGRSNYSSSHSDRDEEGEEEEEEDWEGGEDSGGDRDRDRDGGGGGKGEHAALLPTKS